MILYQLHIMWYETAMIDECINSVLAAKQAAQDANVKVKICLNKQTYIEKPQEGINID